MFHRRVGRWVKTRRRRQGPRPSSEQLKLSKLFPGLKRLLPNGESGKASKASMKSRTQHYQWLKTHLENRLRVHKHFKEGGSVNFCDVAPGRVVRALPAIESVGDLFHDYWWSTQAHDRLAYKKLLCQAINKYMRPNRGRVPAVRPPKGIPAAVVHALNSIRLAGQVWSPAFEWPSQRFFMLRYRKKLLRAVKKHLGRTGQLHLEDIA